MSRDIEFIYFDVGGVAILDFSKTNKWEEMMRDLAVPEARFSEFSDVYKQHTHKLHLGEMTIKEEFEVLKDAFKLDHLPKDYEMLEDFVARFEYNHSLSELIQHISRKKHVGLLTNMLPGMLDSIFEHDLLPDVEWSAIIDSTIVKAEKPQPKIYQIAEEKASIGGESILFVDNLDENLVVAEKEFGWQTFLYDPADPESSTARLREKLSA